MTALWFVAVAVIGFAFFWAMAERNHRRKVARLAERRENLDKQAFVAMLHGTVDASVADWLCDELLPYWQPTGTPHPDDDFLKDLPIDPDEPNDWLGRFCSAQDLHEKSFIEWPYGEATTVRNLAAWLDEGRKAQLSTR